MDMEFATHFPAGVKPTVTLWDRFLAPPEGKMDIDAFAFDMLCVGRSMTYFVKVHVANFGPPNYYSHLHILSDLHFQCCREEYQVAGKVFRTS